MIDAAELYIPNNIRRAFIIDGSSLYRKERPKIPLSAIREALFNAFCHRSYEDDAAIQVDIFWNVVDICSLGLFPSGLTPEDYLSGEFIASRPRNQLIAATLCKSGDIETYGTGLQRIKTVCDARGVPVEMFQRGGSVHV
ncbi:ATP-binding protein [Olsenella uli]|uniref:ATP-binding protein n=1 Tax=Olsenella uli TaxID=133926 RepID=UPI00044D4B83|nr:ATP-binding protein [Olsenella uli]EUB31506.1 ATP-dependent DNA helicase RecG C-terminal domain protein [Olsenella uli MSTE5]